MGGRMTAVELLFLSQEDVVAADGLDMAACMETISETLSLHWRGETIAPPKAAIHWSDDIDTDEKMGRIMAMPAWVGGSTRMTGLKWIPSVPTNPARGLPRGIGLIVLSDPDTGLPVAVIEGTVCSAMRTGAVSGVAARLLARPGTRTLALIGAGVQARTQWMALSLALPGLEEVRLYDLDEPKARRFAVEHEGPFTIAGSAEEACRGADVVVPATMAPEPFIPGDWLAPGSLVISVSSLDIAVDAVAQADLVVADDLSHETAHPSRPLTRAEAAGVLAPGDVVQLGAIIAGDHPGRTGPGERIVVSPVGMGIEDVAEGTRVYRNALARGIGTRLAVWNEPIWT
jgi:ornithine cyclodeaminase/alanine dehydrogenase-like protein (mu-crystallin family)